MQPEDPGSDVGGAAPTDRWRAAGEVPAAVARWAVVVPCVPIVVMMLRKFTGDWQPLGDAAYFSVRSRDVLTASHPWVGAWSSGSARLEESVNNLGPLQLDLLAPFTHLYGTDGLVIGIGLMNVAAVVGVWAVARRLMGPLGVLAAVAMTALLQLSMGSRALVEARQQWALMLPMWCLLFLVWAVAAGRGWALPWLVFVASLIAQTHLTYAVASAPLCVAAVAGFAVVAWRTRNSSAGGSGIVRPVSWSIGVAVLCWWQPLWDQFWGTGNLGDVLGTDAPNVDRYARGARLFTDVLGAPPFWLLDSIERFQPYEHLVGETAAWWRLAVLGLVAIAVALLGRSTASSDSRRTVAMLAPVLVVAGWWASATIPLSAFGIAPQNYRWIWPVGAFITFAMISAVVDAVIGRTGSRRFVTEWSAGALGALTVVATAPNLVTVYRDVDMRNDDRYVHVAEELTAELAASLATVELDRPVVLDRQRQYTFSRFGFAVMAELQAQGVEFLFDSEVDDAARFGEHRRISPSDATSYRRMYIVTGDMLNAPWDGVVLLADATGVTPAEDIERRRLDGVFVAALRDGTLTIDPGASTHVFGDALAEIRTVADGGATDDLFRIARVARTLREGGGLDGAPELLEEIDDWAVLHESHANTRVAVFVDRD
ncbi:MAG: hypothetical protein M3337_04715 [Actinomycetota bacterium]|nr:hypothetical protein [Actinomycetota bacterium]